jgi:hypothetical protein
MAIGTTRYLPLGISTNDRWGIARWRRLAALCALVAVAAAGFVIAEKAFELTTMKPPTKEADSVDHGAPATPTEAPAVPPATEASGLTEASIPPTVPVPGLVDGATELHVPAAAPEHPEPPTVLRGAGIKPR